ncbi:hypothetical protein OAD15_05455 [Hyphomicrobiales bacterium]|nr:hypothetical protein [Hyphomicrobiales bacterium]
MTKKNHILLARIISIIPVILLFPRGIGWILSPAETATDFGFIFNELNNHAQNTLIRDFTAFFLGISIMCIIGALRMKYIWLAAPALIFLIVIVSHIIASIIHNTGFMDVFFGEVLLFLTCSLGSYLIYKQGNG